MRNYMRLWMSLALLSLLLVGTQVGCIKVVKQPTKAPPASTPSAPAQQKAPPSGVPEVPGLRPVVNSFSASPESVPKGQSTTLSWDVSGATTVTIQPFVGAVTAKGTKVITPANSTTFTLTATNSAGSTTGTLTVMVTAPSAGVADLRVIDMWLEGDVVYYKVANMGAVASTGSTSRLLVENNEKSTDYLEPIAAGKEVTGGFFKYQFQVASGAEGGFGYGDQPMSAAQVKVCVDINDETKESDEFNNCLTKMLGLGFDFDFVKYAHIAIWRNGSGVLKWPMVAGDTRGAAFLSTYTLEDGKSYGNALGTYPQQVAFGSLQGMFGQPETKWLGAEASIKAIELPRNVKFSAKVGFKEGANKSTGATVTFGIVDPSGMMVVLKSVKVLYDGKLDLVEADLGPMAGQKITFVLRVEAGDNWDDDYVIWVEPKLTQGQ